jgi:hypothetical protein
MTRTRNVEDLGILQMALVGYEVERRKIEDRIRDLQSQIKGKRITPLSNGAATTHTPGKRNLSAAARNRIAAAQRKRWAEHRRRKALESKA